MWCYVYRIQDIEPPLAVVYIIICVVSMVYAVRVQNQRLAMHKSH